jgi:hypothetical protein
MTTFYKFYCEYCNVFGYWDTQFRLLIGFIRSSLVTTTINYNTVPNLHNLQSLHANLFTLSAVVFTYSVSLNHTLQIKPSIHTISLHMTNFPWLSLKTLSQSLKHLNSLKYTVKYSNPFLFLTIVIQPSHLPHRKQPILLEWSVYWTLAPQWSRFCIATYWYTDWCLPMNYKHSSYCWAHLRDWRLFTDHCLETLWPSTSHCSLLKVVCP